jgi:hypothetical protein
MPKMSIASDLEAHYLIDDFTDFWKPGNDSYSQYTSPVSCLVARWGW